jgi:trypsin
MSPVARLWGGLATVVLVCVLGVTQSASGVVGGRRIRVQSAPWIALVKESIGSKVQLCSGVVIDSRHVLTAAHCIFTPSGVQAALSSLEAVTGTSNFFTPPPTDSPQARHVSAVAVDPGYARTKTVAYDLAVLTLAPALRLGGAVQAAKIASAGIQFPADVSVELAGFGRESAAASPNGSLDELALTVDPKGTCGNDRSSGALPKYAAVVLCARSTRGAICLGDSGGALVEPATRTVVGIASGGTSCKAGYDSIYAFAGAKAIASFIRGAERG